MTANQAGGETPPLIELPTADQSPMQEIGGMGWASAPAVARTTATGTELTQFALNTSLLQTNRGCYVQMSRRITRDIEEIQSYNNTHLQYRRVQSEWMLHHHWSTGSCAPLCHRASSFCRHIVLHDHRMNVIIISTPRTTDESCTAIHPIQYYGGLLTVSDKIEPRHFLP